MPRQAAMEGQNRHWQLLLPVQPIPGLQPCPARLTAPCSSLLSGGKKVIRHHQKTDFLRIIHKVQLLLLWGNQFFVQLCLPSSVTCIPQTCAFHQRPFWKLCNQIIFQTYVSRYKPDLGVSENEEDNFRLFNKLIKKKILIFEEERKCSRNWQWQEITE